MNHEEWITFGNDMAYKEHVSRVRILYKAILRLHRGLPSHLQTLGTQYVKEEFKQHKNCDPSLVPVFMKEWTDYAITLAKQLNQQTTERQIVGKELTEKEIKAFSDQQIELIYELFHITKEMKSNDGYGQKEGDEDSLKS